MGAVSPPLVSDGAEFAAHLEPGDILLFDKLAPLNRLVQWGDNRPVGHCGVWRAPGVYEATLKPRAGGGTYGGVFHTPLDELLGLTVQDGRGDDLALVRTLIAMRHKRMDDARISSVEEFLRARIDDTRFGFRDMVLLAPFAIERSQGSSREPRKALIEGIIRVSKSYAEHSVPGGQEQLFCSELVYRAFAHANLPITIPDSLFERYESRQRRRPAGVQPRFETSSSDVFERHVEPAVDDGGDADVDLPLGDYEEFFERAVLPEASTRADGGIGSYERFPLQLGRRAPEFAEMVTPGDFWSSPDLQAVAVLHRPPGT